MAGLPAASWFSFEKDLKERERGRLMQSRIENYWQGEANRYNENIWGEMNSFKNKPGNI